MQVIAKAKVPIIKFTETASGFAFDVSFDVADGPVAGEFVAKLMAELPPMKPLVLVLKIFLQQRDFNEVCGRLAASLASTERLPGCSSWLDGSCIIISSIDTNIDKQTAPLRSLAGCSCT